MICNSISVGYFDERRTYGNANINQEVSTNKAVTGICRIRVDWLLGQINGPMKEKRLTKIEYSEGQTRRDSGQQGPPQGSQCGPEQSMGRSCGYYENKLAFILRNRIVVAPFSHALFNK